MPSRLRPTPLPLISSLALACSPWPRYTAESPSVGVFDGNLRPAQVREPGDWPGDPSTLLSFDPTVLATPMDSVRFIGELEPFGNLVDDPLVLPFPNCPITSGARGTYDGDVDFIRLQHPGGSLCLLLEAEGDQSTPQWDVVVYDFVDSCVTGPFLTRSVTDEDLPVWTVPGGINYVVEASEEVAIYVSGAQGTYPGAATPYTLDVVSTWDPALCSSLTAANFGDPR